MLDCMYDTTEQLCMSQHKLLYVKLTRKWSGYHWFGKDFVRGRENHRTGDRFHRLIQMLPLSQHKLLFVKLTRKSNQAITVFREALHSLKRTM